MPDPSITLTNCSTMFATRRSQTG